MKTKSIGTCINKHIVNSKAIGSQFIQEFPPQGASYLRTVYLVIILLRHVRYNKDWGTYEEMNPKHFGYALISPMLHPLSHRRQNGKRETRINIHIMLC